MTYKTRLIALGCVLSFNVLAATHYLPMEIEETQANRWSFITSLGYGEYQSMYRNEGQTVLGRFAIDAELLTTNQTAFGLEIGIQNGNGMHVSIPINTLDVLSGVVKTTMKPMVDFLLTANSTPISESLFFTQIKGGIIYRQWQIENDLISNKTELSGEVQAGLGYPLTELTSLNLLYQGIFGSSPKFRQGILEDNTWHFSNLPVQHGVLLGFSVII